MKTIESQIWINMYNDLIVKWFLFKELNDLKNWNWVVLGY
jgi:hypothetical protein